MSLVSESVAQIDLTSDKPRAERLFRRAACFSLPVKAIIQTHPY